MANFLTGTVASSKSSIVLADVTGLTAVNQDAPYLLTIPSYAGSRKSFILVDELLLDIQTIPSTYSKLAEYTLSGSTLVVGGVTYNVYLETVARTRAAAEQVVLVGQNGVTEVAGTGFLFSTDGTASLIGSAFQAQLPANVYAYPTELGVAPAGRTNNFLLGGTDSLSLKVPTDYAELMSNQTGNMPVETINMGGSPQLEAVFNQVTLERLEYLFGGADLTESGGSYTRARLRYAIGESGRASAFGLKIVPIVNGAEVTDNDLIGFAYLAFPRFNLESDLSGQAKKMLTTTFQLFPDASRGNAFLSFISV